MEPTPLPEPYLPALLGELKALAPRLHAAVTAAPPSRGLALLVARLLSLLAQLPTFGPADAGPPPPNNALPPLLLTATKPGRAKATLSPGLIARLGLRAGQPANILPPGSADSPWWYLDLRPDAPGNIDWYPGQPAKLKRLHLPERVLAPGQQLVLRLMPGPPEFAGIYPLLPAGRLPQRDPGGG